MSGESTPPQVRDTGGPIDNVFPNKQRKVSHEFQMKLITRPFNESEHEQEPTPQRTIRRKTKGDLLWDDYDITPTEFSTRTNDMLREIVAFMAQISMRIETLVFILKRAENFLNNCAKTN